VSHNFKEPEFEGKLVSELDKYEKNRYRRHLQKESKKRIKERSVYTVFTCDECSASNPCILKTTDFVSPPKECPFKGECKIKPIWKKNERPEKTS
jgi:hypothetical protein